MLPTNRMAVSHKGSRSTSHVYLVEDGKNYFVRIYKKLCRLSINLQGSDYALINSNMDNKRTMAL